MEVLSPVSSALDVRAIVAAFHFFLFLLLFLLLCHLIDRAYGSSCFPRRRQRSVRSERVLRVVLGVHCSSHSKS